MKLNKANKRERVNEDDFMTEKFNCERIAHTHTQTQTRIKIRHPASAVITKIATAAAAATTVVYIRFQ